MAEAQKMGMEEAAKVIGSLTDLTSWALVVILRTVGNGCRILSRYIWKSVLWIQIEVDMRKTVWEVK
ncbi:hypothetical protein ACQP3J_33830, partial [Escherichia coli]